MTTIGRPGVAGRVRQARRLLDTEGKTGVARRLRERAATRIAPPGSAPLPLTAEQLLAAAQRQALGSHHAAPLAWRPGEPLTIAWVVLPAGPGSGGMTTIFRMVTALETAGHRCVVYLFDRHGWDVDRHRETIASWWPQMRAEIRDLGGGLEDAHAVLATSWETAYAVLASPARGARLYFVQDFEPSFHEAGSESLLAEATYRFGFHGVTAGAWLAQVLARDYGMPVDHFDFGCDLMHYRLDTRPRADEFRRGVCYFCRPSTPRRAHALSMSALAVFAERRPDIDIHLFGEDPGPLPFRARHHGLLTPPQLNHLYNRCVAGLSLSATNVSLVPHEMLASGCIPVVNDAPHNRVVLDNNSVEYASPTPGHLALALERLVQAPPALRAARARQASASVTSRSWDAAGEKVEAVVRDTVARSQAPVAAFGHGPAQ